MEDAYNLERFVLAQEEGNAYRHAAEELRRGRKASHWMWFVFPQVAGLGQSSTSRYFAITSLAEAIAYLQHPTLGPRLRECVDIVANVEGATAVSIFGPVDAQKLRSSATLFCRADPTATEFRSVLDIYFEGKADDATDRLLGRDS